MLLGVKRTIIQENGRVMNACLFPLKTIAIHPNQCSFQVPFLVRTMRMSVMKMKIGIAKNDYIQVSVFVVLALKERHLKG